MLIFYSILGFMLLIACAFILPRPIFSKTTLFLIIFFPVIVISLYWHWGHSQVWLDYEKSQQLPKSLPPINLVIQQLQQHLAQQPNSGEGWYLLGRLYSSQGNFTEAGNAYAKANALQPHQINTLINYAEALFMQQNPKNNQQIESLLNEALKLDPQNDEATNLLAINYYQQHQYQQAITLWEKLSEKYPPDTPDGQALLKAIAQAQQQTKAQ